MKSKKLETIDFYFVVVELPLTSSICQSLENVNYESSKLDEITHDGAFLIGDIGAFLLNPGFLSGDPF